MENERVDLLLCSYFISFAILFIGLGVCRETVAETELEGCGLLAGRVVREPPWSKREPPCDIGNRPVISQPALSGA